MKIVVAGGFGWIGQALCQSLVRDGHRVVVLSRRPRRANAVPPAVLWDGRTLGPWARELDGADAVVNLAGESVAARRWTAARKNVLRASRVEPTAALVAALKEVESRPLALVNASAVGYYGDGQDDPITEEALPGHGFLAQLVQDWEAAASPAAALGVRVALIRTGIVLGPGGGALARMALPFHFFVGGPMGTGNQWVPWVHLDDVVGIFRLAIEDPQVEGPINATAPEPVTNRQLATGIGEVLGRPAWLPVPAIALRLALGEMAEAVLASQRVIPAAALRFGYEFQEPSLTRALQKALRDVS